MPTRDQNRTPEADPYIPPEVATRDLRPRWLKWALSAVFVPVALTVPTDQRRVLEADAGAAVVRAGGDRQECHERIRVLAQEAVVADDAEGGRLP